MLLHPHATVNTMGLLTATKGEGSLSMDDSAWWDKLISEFADVFTETRKPVEHIIKYTINLLPGLQPPAQY